MTNRIKKIVITGGDCAGKTTALAQIIQFCQNIGKHPVIVPEAASDLINSGLDPTRPEFQELIIRKIQFDEGVRLDAAAAGNFPAEPVFIYDRGYYDCLAYMDKPSFEATLEVHGLNEVTARDTYAGVIFLDSAAVGAEEFYNYDNPARQKRTLEEARALNERTKLAWMGTPHFEPIPNRPGASFDQKMVECLQALARFLGVPIPMEYERKFKLHTFDLSMLPDHAVCINITQTYLTGKWHLFANRHGFAQFDEA